MSVKQTKQKGCEAEVPLPFRVNRLDSTPCLAHRKGEDVLNLGADLLHLQLRDELTRLRRASVSLPRPAGNSPNEQYARARLHARNEADIDMPRAESHRDDVTSIDVQLTTHWTRILQHDLYGANDDIVEGPADGAVAFARLARGDGVAGTFRRAVLRLAEWTLRWLAA
jgi:hypothetical protein